MKDSRLYIILLIMALVICITTVARPQSFYSNQYKNGRSSQLNPKTVMQKKQVNAYQQHSLLYKMRRNIAHAKKRKAFKAKTR